MTIEPRAARHTRLKKLSLFGIATVVTLIIAGCVTPQDEASDFWNKGNYTKAIELSKQATEKDSSNFYAWFWLGISYYSNKQYDEALAALHKAIDLHPAQEQLEDAYKILGCTYYEKKQYSQAIFFLKKSGLDANNFNMLGAAYVLSGQFQQGIEALKRAVELKPDNQLYRDNLRSAENTRRETEAPLADKARAWRELAVKPKLPEEVQKCRIMAEDAFNNDKDFEKALGYYEKGLAIDPLWPDGQLNAALIAGELHRYAQAASHLKRYLELVPDSPNASGAREKLYLWEGKAEEEMQKPPTQTP